jgi:hypothetical protein
LKPIRAKLLPKCHNMYVQEQDKDYGPFIHEECSLEASSEKY